MTFKLSDSNFQLKNLVVQNEGHNLDFLEYISLLGLSCLLFVHFQDEMSNLFKIVYLQNIHCMIEIKFSSFSVCGLL